MGFFRCSTGVALHPLKILVSHLPPPVPGGVAPKFGSEKVSRYTGVSQLQLRVSRYTVQLGKQCDRNVLLASQMQKTLLGFASYHTTRLRMAMAERHRAITMHYAPNPVKAVIGI